MRVTPNTARTGPTREAPHVTEEMPIDQRDNDIGGSGRALAILKFSENCFSEISDDLIGSASTPHASGLHCSATGPATGKNIDNVE
jgi:hypothetical protein